MAGRLYRDDPLSPHERDEYERDLIAFCDRELDLLGDIRGRQVLYAGGTSPLWIEGLSERIGARGSLTVLDLDSESLEAARESFAEGELPVRPDFVVGDVFDLPFESASSDLVYSSGLLHELDVRDREEGIVGALNEFLSVLIPGGAMKISDFVSDVPTSQIEEEEIMSEISHLTSGTRLFGIQKSERIGEILHENYTVARAEKFPPFEIHHLDKLFLAQPEPDELKSLNSDDSARLGRRWSALREQVVREGYTRPATIFATVYAT